MGIWDIQLHQDSNQVSVGLFWSKTPKILQVSAIPLPSDASDADLFCEGTGDLTIERESHMDYEKPPNW